MLVPIGITEDDLMRISHWYSVCFKTREAETEDETAIAKIRALLISMREESEADPHSCHRIIPRGV